LATTFTRPSAPTAWKAIPACGLPAAVGQAASSSLRPPAGLMVQKCLRARCFRLLNHQLYQSTPAEKLRHLVPWRLTTAASGNWPTATAVHLPPIILAARRSLRRLERGGTVIGLFDHRSLRGEHGNFAPGRTLFWLQRRCNRSRNNDLRVREQRLIDLVWKNRDLAVATHSAKS